jgi:hypothetical protein
LSATRSSITVIAISACNPVGWRWIIGNDTYNSFSHDPEVFGAIPSSS